ncbi:unnamed protein product, partial [Ectocarpus fasciculatus]
EQARRQGRTKGKDEALEGGSSVEHTGPYSVALPAVEQRLRTRIDKFVRGYGLTPMGEAVARSWIQSIGSDSTGDFSRVRGWLVSRLNSFGSSGTSTPASSKWQAGCPEIIPGLRSKAFWSAEDFDLPWVTDFEKGFHDVRGELLALRGQRGFQPYRAPNGRSCSGDLAAKDGVGSHCHEGGDWNVFYLFLHSIVDFSQNRSMCPKTVKLVEALPRHHKHAFFSALAPGTHVVKHNGPTNKKLRVHLPLLGPGGGLSRLRVGSETREAVEGKALVFDDSFEHEAWNDNDDDNDNGHDKSEEENTGEGESEGDTDDDGDDNIRSSNEHSIGRNRRGTDNNAREPPCLDESQGDGCNGPCRPGEPGTRGERGDCSLGEGRGEATENRCRRSRAAPRVTLIADVWHPDLSNSEVRFLAFLQEASLRLEKRLVTNVEREETCGVRQTGTNCKAMGNFLGVINRARGLCSDESNIFGNS